ncbi:MAG: carboxyl transferase domain-containing protein, partial [Leptospirales bacterium]
AESFHTIIKQLIAGEYKFRMNRVITVRALAALDHYVRIKRVFSSNLAGDVSFFAELNLMISEEKPADYRPSRAFRREIEPLLLNYGYKKDRYDAEEERARLNHIYLYLYHSRSACAERRDIVEALVHLVAAAARQYAAAESPAGDQRVAAIRRTIKEVLYQELSELDESLAETLRQILQTIPAEESRLDASVDDEDRELTALDATHPFLFFEDFDLIDLHDDLLSSLDGSRAPAGPATFKSSRTGEAFARRLAALKATGQVRRLYSPLEDVLAFLYESGVEGEAPRLIAYGSTGEFGGDASNAADKLDHGGRAREIWNAVVRSLQVLFALRFVAKNPPFGLPAGGHRVEVFIDGPVDCTTPSGRMLSYWDLLRELEEQFSFLKLTTFECALLHFTDARGSRSIQAQSDGENLAFHYSGYPDCPDPYVREVETLSPADAKLFARGKWPVDLWVRESLDRDSAKEIILPGIDRIPRDQGGFQPVGAAVYTGTIEGRTVVYFMKDSRVRGGATGNLEGLKYVAAAYLAYVLRAPLFVWNDGAGANIKEGVVSLNRAAQGFMMNTLLAQNVDRETFRRYTDRNFDSALHSVIQAVRDIYAPTWTFGDHEPLFTVAIGVGSSAGLDVYGSSQATLQVLLDSPESYRVLTGSNVIRSVTGEDITNYEIGGARIMGKWTGTADWIARDKIHLLAILRRINLMFGARVYRADPKRAGSDRPKKAGGGTQAARVSLASHSVLNEAVIARCVDHGSFWPLKQEFAGAGAVIGGLARLGGNRVMLLGMRSHFGIRSTAAVIRSRELLKIAARTETPRILIFGRRWF